MPWSRRPISTAVMLVATASILAPVPAPAQGVTSSGAFVAMLGRDTITVEQYTRRGDVIQGDIIQRQPRTTVMHYTLTLDAHGYPARFEYTTQLPDGSPVPGAPIGATMAFTADSVTSTIHRAGQAPVVRSAEASRAFPDLGFAYGMYDLVIAAMRAQRTDSMAVAMVSPGATRPNVLTFVRRGASAYTVDYFGSPQRVAVDANGRVTSVNGMETTEKVIARRVPSVNITALAQAFATRGIGVASPRDTMTAAVGAAHLWVDYSRPAARGRHVFGPTGVLGDTLWRTGANEATQFRTDVDLVIDGKTLPAGMYTLWTHAHMGRYALTFNTQVGQWGTDHDSTKDLLTVPLAVTTLPAVVERFTIAVRPAGANAGVLTLSWDTTELSVRFQTR